MSNTSNIMDRMRKFAVPMDNTKKLVDSDKVVNPTKVVCGNVYIQATGVTTSRKVKDEERSKLRGVLVEKTIKILNDESRWKFSQVYIAIFDGSNKISIGSSMNTNKLMEIINDGLFSEEITVNLEKCFYEFTEKFTRLGKQVILA